MNILDFIIVVVSFVVSVLVAYYFAYKAGYTKAEGDYFKRLADITNDANELKEAFLNIDSIYKSQLKEFKSEYKTDIVNRLKEEYNIVFTDKPE